MSDVEIGQVMALASSLQLDSYIKESDGLFLNSELRIWPPDLVNYNYVITVLFKYPATYERIRLKRSKFCPILFGK